LEKLAEMGVTSLMIEGGAQVIASFLRERLVDMVVLTIAPLYLGGLPAVEEVRAAGCRFRSSLCGLRE
jgi:riboflavin biosynthesis pyrimidine reductase